MSGPVAAAADAPWLRRYPAGLASSIVPDFSDMLSLFAATVHRHRDQPAVLYFDGRISFAELDARSDALAAYLIAHGFAAGDRIAVQVQNDPAFVIALLGAWKAGGVAVAMNPMYRAREIEYLLRDSGATVLVAMEDSFEDIIRPVFESGSTELREVLLAGEADDQHRNDPRMFTGERPPAAAGVARYREIVRADHAPLPAHAPEPDDLAVLMYTSGTTGEPKGAMISHRALARASQTYREWVGLTAQDRILGVAPLFHITGLVGHVGASLLTGAALILHHRFVSDVVLDTIREHRPTFTVGSVTVFNNLASREDVTAADFASLRVVCSGGAPIAPALSEMIRERVGVVLHNLYGMTETCGPAIGVPVGMTAPTDPTSGALSVGVPVFDTVVRILDDAGSEVAIGEIGEIHMRGPQVIPAYWNRPVDSAAKITDGEFATGDVGFMDELGWFYLVDRKGDLINAAGFKVWPREVEDVLYTHPAVQEAAVVGVPDPYRGETVKAIVVLKPSNAVTGDELIEHCRGLMAAYKYPRLIEFRDSLPKSATGKILRRELR